MVWAGLGWRFFFFVVKWDTTGSLSLSWLQFGVWRDGFHIILSIYLRRWKGVDGG